MKANGQDGRGGRLAGLLACSWKCADDGQGRNAAKSTWDGEAHARAHTHITHTCMRTYTHTTPRQERMHEHTGEHGLTHAHAYTYTHARTHTKPWQERMHEHTGEHGLFSKRKHCTHRPTRKGTHVPTMY